jgi:hypothetical protein
MAETHFHREPNSRATTGKDANHELDSPWRLLELTVIDAIEESDRDWDWYAFDPHGMIGHFTTAGMRPLPRTVKQDREAALQLIEYFSAKAPKTSPYLVRTEAEADSGGWANESARSRYLKDFTQMAAVGLFSYDTPTSGSSTKYFLVAFPERPLHIADLPSDIRSLVMKVKSPYPFPKSPYISELETQDW